MARNPFMLKAARKKFDDLGIEVGDYVRVSWNYDKAYGPGTSYHEGKLSRLDDWIRVEDSPRSPGYLNLPITSVVSVEAIEIEKVPPPEDVPTSTPKLNPFLKSKRRIPGKS